jgi:hypothetical protein
VTRRDALAATAAGLAGLTVLGLTGGEANAQLDLPPRKYPELREPYEKLLAARDGLKGGRGIFGGHREKAMAKIDEALKEIEKAAAFADK